MPSLALDVSTTPHEDDLGLIRLRNSTGLSISVLPGGALFAIEQVRDDRRTMINRTLASPVGAAMGGLYLRAGGAEPAIVPIVGAAGAPSRVGHAQDRFVWEVEGSGLRSRVCLWLHPERNLWLWRAQIVNARPTPVDCDLVFIQDLGLGDRGFVMNNEAYANQYIDHHAATHPRFGRVLLARQNLSQSGAFPWVAHACLAGARAYATDFLQLAGPESRDGARFEIPFGTDLANVGRQHEAGCAALQSEPANLPPGASASFAFFGLFLPDHPSASSDADLAVVEQAGRDCADWSLRDIVLSAPARSIPNEATGLSGELLDEAALTGLYPQRQHMEGSPAGVLSFFVPGRSHSRHVVLREKDRRTTRRHGALLRSGQDLTPSDSILCVTCWMHGVFGSQLTIGNTSFHQLFSISRDPYNLTRASGLRILVDLGEGWRLLCSPSLFEIGLSDCRWIYRLGDRTIAVSAAVSGEEPAMQWRVAVEGRPCRFLVFGQVVVGEREFAHAGCVEIDRARHRFTFRPDPQDKWARCYPQAVYHLTIGSPQFVDALGADELLYLDGRRRGGGYIAIRTTPTDQFAFAVVGSLTSPQTAEALASKYQTPIEESAMLASADRFWLDVTRGLRIVGDRLDADAQAADTIFPWFAHDAMAHLTTPRGLEQYSGAAWGVRDVCQGPVELLLALEHDGPVREILRTVFAQQYERKRDWPQWFMLPPYSLIRDRNSHGDVIAWPLKALCDYLEATGDFGVLDESVAWRDDDSLLETARADPIADHVRELIETIRTRYIAGTHLIRYGEGDWNDSMQPVDPAKRDWMVSSWTVALVYQQFRRYAELLRYIGQSGAADRLDGDADAMRDDFNRFLIRDAVVAGYGLFRPEGGAPDLLLHPSDRLTGVSYSLLPMTQGIIAGLFTHEQALRHVGLIREHLLFSDGVRLMDRPIAYHGGVETIFRRAESAAFFGREIGLMYVHAHLRYAEAMATLGDAKALWDALAVINPIAVTERVGNASLRQRNAYFSSSDAAFFDRRQASAEWRRLIDEQVPVDGGWRIYSSGPGLYANMLIQLAFGIRRRFGRRKVNPLLPDACADLRLELSAGGPR